jgi:hypothetical protein
MPGDPKECLQHAVQCQRLADEARSVKARETFLDLAKTWNKLAWELERSQALIDAYRGDDKVLSDPKRGP